MCAHLQLSAHHGYSDACCTKGRRAEASGITMSPHADGKQVLLMAQYQYYTSLGQL